MNAHRLLALSVVTVMAIAGQAADAARPAAPTRLSALDQAHADALASFRRARFSEAYGRFIKLAEAGHPASARYAIWMCENGNSLFGVLWDCAPQELEDWQQVARLTPSGPAVARPHGTVDAGRASLRSSRDRPAAGVDALRR